MNTCSKTHFADEKIAMEYVVRLQATSKRQVVPHRAYLCETCLNWHITSLPKEKEKGLRMEVQRQNKTLEQKNNLLAKRDRKIDSFYERVADLNKKVDFYRNKSAELEAKKYLRFGDIPIHEKSGIYNFDEGQIGQEEGVSVYYAMKVEEEYLPVIPSLNYSACTTLSGVLGRPKFLVTGEEVGIGSDGEPLLRNVTIIERL